MEQNFDDLQTDAIQGTAMMQVLGLTRQDIEDPRKFSKLREVIAFFSMFPDEQRDSILRKITLGKGDKIDIAWEYAVLSKRHQDASKLLSEKKDLFDQLSLANEDTTEIKSEVDNLTKQVEFLTNEITIYG